MRHCFFLNNFITILSYRTIQQCKVYISIASSAFIELCSRHNNLILELFQNTPLNPAPLPHHPSLLELSHAHAQACIATNSLSASAALPVLNMPCKVIIDMGALWTGFLHLAYSPLICVAPALHHLYCQRKLRHVMHHILSVHSYTDEHLSCFYFWMAMNNTAVAIGVQRFVWTDLFGFS